MIVAMKKTAVIVRSSDASRCVQDLRGLGVLHVEHQQPPQAKVITELREEINLIERALSILSGLKVKSATALPKEKKTENCKQIAYHIVEHYRHKEQLEHYSRSLSIKVNQWEEWGDFEPKKFSELSRKGIFLGLYQIPLKQIPRLPAEATLKKISVKGGIANCLLISREKIDTGYKEVPLPAMSLRDMRKRLSEDVKLIARVEEDISRYLVCQADLANFKKQLQKELEFNQALAGMSQQGALAYIAGYLPAENQKQVLELAKTSGWGILLTDPAENENPPVLLRNPKWISLINPLYKLMEVVPNYREIDISPIFLLFLALFFGMIIGDAGYGAVYFGLTFFARRKYGSKVKDKTAFSLFYLFSSCAIIWGLLTGTVFGQQWYQAQGFKALAPVLNDAKFLMAFCFLLGALQLSLGHGWQALTKFPSLTALADIGFICLLWAGFFLAKMFILGDAFPALGAKLIWLGVTLIILFISPRENFFKTIASGLGALALGLMGNFGDVVSYIRLFAVGLAGVAVANSVNMLAAGARGNIVAQLLILFIGHSINIILGPVSVLVHGIRLNLLEFSLLHGNVTWSGLAYKPLKE